MLPSPTPLGQFLLATVTIRRRGKVSVAFQPQILRLWNPDKSPLESLNHHYLVLWSMADTGRYARLGHGAYGEVPNRCSHPSLLMYLNLIEMVPRTKKN